MRVWSLSIVNKARSIWTGSSTVVILCHVRLGVERSEPPFLRRLRSRGDMVTGASVTAARRAAADDLPDRAPPVMSWIFDAVSDAWC